MSSLIQFQVISLPAMRVLGKAIYPKLDMQQNPIPAFWDECFKDGTFQTLDALKDHHVDDSYVGFMCDYSHADGTFTYVCGMMMKEGCPVPDGYAFKDVPASNVAVGWIQGPEKQNYMEAHGLTQQALEQAGHKADESAAWCAEVYNCPRFTQPQPNGDVILDYYIPYK